MQRGVQHGLSLSIEGVTGPRSIFMWPSGGQKATWKRECPSQGLLPHDLLVPQRPRLLIPSPWSLRFQCVIFAGMQILTP